MSIDLNCDLGESFGAYKIGNDEEVIKFVDRVNIACGFHAGDPIVMDKTVSLAKDYNVKVGAHPSYRDFVGFGRRFLDASPKEIENDIIYQIGALHAFCLKHSIQLDHVKPHGALYNRAAVDFDTAMAVARGIKAFDRNLKMVVLCNSEMVRAAEMAGLTYLKEAFADRHYDDNGRLVSRKVNGAVIDDLNLILSRVKRMITDGMVESITGKVIKLNPDTICVHGDNEKALEIAKNLNLLLKEYKNSKGGKL
ncbi:5-oxoprolinase subunit PxpA [Calditerrivibrio nitroreducens]|uniref:5-oxoprolinase subunit A n=1 Tax=Calditerrivibrio nitroreducens (strain DSM 19672 / NBRC 101217 / Yu37-1) TaxID=768670 RepID=E4TEH0_CALNY|nr:5-oxoprolinase subunit PxpA [Calditerrivibrio nitroreducens]ADR18296.1 LamB/YcsF family protein [Calditerrivibrio nitroreducens DSM 19672]